MDELFRFSVLRPVDASVPEVVAAPTRRPTSGRKPRTPGEIFALAVQATLAKPPRGENNEQIWAQLEGPAAAYLVVATAPIVDDPLWAALAAFTTGLLALGMDGVTDPDAAAIQAVFSASAMLDAATLDPYRADLADLFLAQVIVRRGGAVRLAPLLASTRGLSTALKTGLPDIAARVQTAALALAGPQHLIGASAGPAPAKVAFNAALLEALNATLLLPPALTAALRRPVLGAGLREMHVVKQHIRRYQRSEIARVENILKGETREHDQKHSLSTETDTFVQSVDTTETDKELDTDDKTSIKTEADDQLKTDTKVDGGVHAQYSGPSYKINADLTASYDRASDSTRKYASETAKQVTQKAVSKVTDQMTRSQTTKVRQKLIDFERQRFENETGTQNVVGVYQWVRRFTSPRSSTSVAISSSTSPCRNPGRTFWPWRRRAPGSPPPPSSRIPWGQRSSTDRARRSRTPSGGCSSTSPSARSTSARTSPIPTSTASGSGAMARPACFRRPRRPAPTPKARPSRTRTTTTSKPPTRSLSTTGTRVRPSRSASAACATTIPTAKSGRRWPSAMRS